jgi:hypothetical protein
MCVYVNKNKYINLVWQGLEAEDCQDKLSHHKVIEMQHKAGVIYYADYSDLDSIELRWTHLHNM